HSNHAYRRSARYLPRRHAVQRHERGRRIRRFSGWRARPGSVGGAEGLRKRAREQTRRRVRAMSSAIELLNELRDRGIRVEPRPERGTVYLTPKGRITPDLVERVRQHKAALLAHLSVEQSRDEALAILQRLKTFSLPAGRIPAAREIALRFTSALRR